MLSNPSRDREGVECMPLSISSRSWLEIPQSIASPLVDISKQCHDDFEVKNHEKNFVSNFFAE